MPATSSETDKPRSAAHDSSAEAVASSSSIERVFVAISHSFPFTQGRDTGILVIQKAPQLPAPRRMLQLSQRLGLDLPDTLARHRELLADFLQRVVGVHADAEAHAQHALLARRERGEHPRRGLAQVRLDRRVNRQDRVLVLDEIAEMRVLLIADGRLE